MTAPVLIEFVTTRFRCPFCRRPYAQRAAATRHLAQCFSNPAVRSCKTCVHQNAQTLCDVGALEDYGWYCPTCGEELDQQHGSCSGGHTERPVQALRVQCDQYGSRAPQ